MERDITLPLVWVQCGDGYGNYHLVDGSTGEMIFQNVCGWFCDAVFRLLDNENIVYVRQFD